MKPMLARPIRNEDQIKLVNSPDWIIEPKIDGERLIVETIYNEDLDDVEVTGWNRAGTRVTNQLADRFLAEIRKLGGGFILDGELLDGIYLVFDAVHISDLVEPHTTLKQRVKMLDNLFNLWRPPFHLAQPVPRAYSVEDKWSMLEYVHANRGEGVMFKKLSSPYQPGVRSWDWLKLKRYHEVDCVVTGVGTVEANMTLGVYRDSELVDVGSVGTLTGDQSFQEGDVVAVRVLYASESGRLYQPTLPKVRTDKQPRECVWQQILDAQTNKHLVFEWNMMLAEKENKT